MKKITFEKWESRFYDVPFIKPNFDLLESMGLIPIWLIVPKIQKKERLNL